MPRNETLLDMLRDTTNGVVKEAIAPVPQKPKELFEKIKGALAEAKSNGITPKEIRSVFEDVVAEFNEEEPVEEGMGEPTQDTLESVLLEKDDKKKEDDWKDERSHDEAVKSIVRDSWKEIYADNKFKGDGAPTREEVMTEVEFQSKHGLDHRPDASAIKYDAFKKVMKKVKNIQKKLDAESDETPEEEDTTAQAGFQAPQSTTPKEVIGMKT